MKFVFFATFTIHRNGNVMKFMIFQFYIEMTIREEQGLISKKWEIKILKCLNFSVVQVRV